MRCLLFNLFILLFSFKAFSYELGRRFHFGVGVEISQPQYQEQRYKFNDYSSIKKPIANTFSRISWTTSYRLLKDFPVYAGIKTNRGINFAVNTTAFDKVTNQSVNVKTKSIADTVFLAIAIHKKILPFIVMTNLQSKSTVQYTNGFQVKSTNSSILYGGGITIPLTKKQLISFTYYKSNSDFNMKKIYVISYNYLLV